MAQSGLARRRSNVHKECRNVGRRANAGNGFKGVNDFNEVIRVDVFNECNAVNGVNGFNSVKSMKVVKGFTKVKGECKNELVAANASVNGETASAKKQRSYNRGKHCSHPLC